MWIAVKIILRRAKRNKGRLRLTIHFFTRIQAGVVPECRLTGNVQLPISPAG
jgi:hypothetical protein